MSGNVLNPGVRRVVAEISGSSLLEQLTEADLVSGDLVFASAVTLVEVVNEDVAAGTFTINGTPIRVPAQATTGVFRPPGTPSATVSVTGSARFLVNRRA